MDEEIFVRLPHEDRQAYLDRLQQFMANLQVQIERVQRAIAERDRVGAYIQDIGPGATVRDESGANVQFNQGAGASYTMRRRRTRRRRRNTRGRRQ